MRRCNALIICLTKVQVLYYTTQLLHGISRAQSECPASRQTSFYIAGVSTASNSVIGSTYKRVDRVFLTQVGETDLIQRIDSDVTNMNTISKSFIVIPGKFKCLLTCLVHNNKYNMSKSRNSSE